MRDAHDEIAAKQIRVVAIGNGTPFHAKAFREDERIPFDLWVDTNMEAYRVAGLRRGVTKSLSLKTFGHAFRAMRHGFRQTKVQGDPWQLGGAFVISRQGDVIYQQISREAGDHAPISELLAAGARAHI